MGTKVIDQILTMMLHGSPEEKHYIYNESDIILECKLCRNLFRALTGFILHRKSLCLKPLEKSVSINTYDQTMRTETFKNVTFITNASTFDQQQQQQQQKELLAAANSTEQQQHQQQPNNLSAADHFQYLQNYVSQINESIESKSNLKAVLNLTQEGIGDAAASSATDSDVQEVADDRSKLLENYVVRVASPDEGNKKTDTLKTDRIILTEESSPQTSIVVSNVQGPSSGTSGSTSQAASVKSNSSQQANGFSASSSDTEIELPSSKETSPCSTPQLKISCAESVTMTAEINDDLEQQDAAAKQAKAMQLRSNKSTTKTVAAQGSSHASSSSGITTTNRQIEIVDGSESSANEKSPRTEIIIDDSVTEKDVIEIDDLDCLEERVTQSLSLDNLIYVPLDQNNSLDQNPLGQKKPQQQQQHYLCPYCPTTLIYDAYMPFCQHLASVHGVHKDPMDTLGQSLQLTSPGSVSDITERAGQKSSEEIVLELADFQNLQCRKCKHSFTQRCSLRRHILEIHSEKLGYYSCPFCTSKVWFRYFRTFLAHLKNLHGFQKDQIYRIHRNLQKNSWVEFGNEQLSTEATASNTQHSNRSLQF